MCTASNCCCACSACRTNLSTHRPPCAPAPASAKLNPLGQIPVLQDGELVYRRQHRDPGLPVQALRARQARCCRTIRSARRRYSAGCRWPPAKIAFGPASMRAPHACGARRTTSRSAQAIAARLLAFMEQHLAARSFLAAAHATLADLACYSLRRACARGRVSLEPYPAVRGWLARVEALPRFLPMPASCRCRRRHEPGFHAGELQAQALARRAVVGGRHPRFHARPAPRVFRRRCRSCCWPRSMRWLAERAGSERRARLHRQPGPGDAARRRAGGLVPGAAGRIAGAGFQHAPPQPRQRRGAQRRRERIRDGGARELRQLSAAYPPARRARRSSAAACGRDVRRPGRGRSRDGRARRHLFRGDVRRRARRGYLASRQAGAASCRSMATR